MEILSMSFENSSPGDHDPRKELKTPGIGKRAILALFEAIYTVALHILVLRISSLHV
jgi:hypothetical protein